MMATRRVVALMVAGVLVSVAATGYMWIRRGFGARDEPSALETFIARSMRELSASREAVKARSPVDFTPEVLAEARAHFANHCATCHGNDGSGNTEIGRNLYPRVPDMRLRATQMLTDGEIYSIIHNGIRLTGMPAWGPADNDVDSWKLVHFIRHLPDLTSLEIEEMEKLRPKNAAEWEQERQEREFLSGQPPDSRSQHTDMPMPSATGARPR